MSCMISEKLEKTIEKQKQKESEIEKNRVIPDSAINGVVGKTSKHLLLVVVLFVAFCCHFLT